MKPVMGQRRIRRVVAVAVAGAVLAACPGPAQEERPAAEVPVTEVGPGMAADSPQAMPLPERVEIEAPGVRADAVMSPMAGSTHVVIQVHQAPANATLQGALHSGSCTQPGPQVALLGSVVTDAAGTGRGEAHVRVPAHLVFDGGHHIRLQAPGEAAAAPAAGAGTQPAAAGAACTDIPERAIPVIQ